MNKPIIAVLMLAFAAAPALAAETAPVPTSTVAQGPAVATKGKMLVAANGERLGPVYRVDADGPQLILEGRMVTVPASTLSLVGGKLTTSMTKNQVTELP